ncbi:MAG: DMT family transporter [Anaeromyxobacteraceae bacterium]
MIAPWAALSFTLSAACWGLAIVATKGLLEGAPPLTALLVQVAGSVAFLWVAVAVTRSRLPVGRTTLVAIASGFLEPGLAYAAGLLGLQLTTASSAAIIGATETPMILLLAALFLRERMGLAALGLAALAGLGVGLLMLPDLSGLAGGSVAGDLLLVLSTFIAAVYVVISRRIVGDFDALPLATIQQTGGLAVAGLLWLVARNAGWAAAADVPLSWGTLGALALTGVVQYAMAFWFWLKGLKHVPASRAAVFLALIPVFGVAGAAVVLGERLVPAQWAGAVLVVAAVLALSRAEGRDPLPSPTPERTS